MKLRSVLRKRRRALDAARPDAAQAAAAALPLDALPAFEWFASYHAVGSELDPAPLLRAWSRPAAGWRCR